MTAAAANPDRLDWGITEERVLAALERLIAAADPAAIVAFGSRVRGSARHDSDLDLAVILPGETVLKNTSVWSAVSGLQLSIDLIPTNEVIHERFRHSINSVHHDIEEEGIVLYRKGVHGSPDRDAVAKLVAGRANHAA